MPNNIDYYKKILKEKNDILTEKKIIVKILNEDLNYLKKEQSDLVKYNDIAEKSIIVIKKFLNERRSSAIKTLENLGTLPIQKIYDSSDYKITFKTEKDRKDNKLYIKVSSRLQDQILETGLIGHRGGGLIVVASISLLLSALDWLGYKGPVIMDEALNELSNDEKIQNVAEFLKEYSDHKKRQILFVTHNVNAFESVASNIIKIKKIKGVSCKDGT